MIGLVVSWVDVLFLSLAWMYKLAITKVHWFNARSVVYILYKKLLDDNFYKQWELGG
jgi:hypothetical protein